MPAKTVRSRTKGYKTPRNVKTSSFKELQTYWYKVLKDEGFVDIECGRDTNQLSTSTLPGDRFVFFDDTDDDGPEGTSTKTVIERQLEANAEIFGTETLVSDLPEANAWREIGIAANELPNNYKHRRFIIDLSMTGCIAQYLLARHKLTQWQAYRVWNEFLERVELTEYRHLLVQGRTKKP